MTTSTPDDDCGRRSFPPDAVWVAALLGEYPAISAMQMRTMYSSGDLCHWKVGRKIFVSRADFVALLDAGLNAAACTPKVGA